MRLALSFLLAIATLSSQAVTAAVASPAPAEKIFMPVTTNQSSGAVTIDVPAWNQDLLMMVTLENALGSNDIGLDRAQNSDPRVVEFRRLGKRVLLVQKNTRYVAHSNDKDEAKAASDAFAEAVLWSGTLVEGSSNRIDITSLLLKDWHGVGARLQQSKQGSYSLDKDRSAVLPDEARAFPDNSDFTALLTFNGAGEGHYVQQIAADPQVLTVKQRVSFVRLPDDGFKPRTYHPASGGFSIGRYDFAQAITDNLDVRWQPRFNLQKTDPTAARSRVRKPIVFYLDRGTPEPIRSALLEGVNWWKQAFDDAGFIDAFRAELAPVGMSMSDVRYNTITWTHRATRGWSYGGGLIDPRTGEIIKGYVNLGSQRVRQDLLIAESLLAPYGKNADPALMAQAKEMALARLRQLGAHEVGHALGFAHNFAASRAGNGSVLDYPHPQITLDANGNPQMLAAYNVGVGEWDKFLVAHAYGDFPADQEAGSLAKLRADIAAKGYRYASDPDSRSSNSAHESGSLWDVPGEPLNGLEQLLKIRRVALARFAEGALPPNRQLGEAERRLVPLYLLHRYQAEAVIRLIGGNNYSYGLVADSDSSSNPVAADQQKRALQAAANLISDETLSIPDSVLNVLSPPSNEYNRSPEDFDTLMDPMFDPMQAAGSATALITQFAFNPSRLNRVAFQHSRNSNSPSVDDVFDALIMHYWQTSASGKNALLSQTRNWVLLDAALLTLDGGNLHPAVAAQWRQSLQSLSAKLRNAKDLQSQQAGTYIQRYLDDPSSVKLRALPTVPPGAPI
ncbi:MAG: zinc-dependent metalloprotease [Arenimonas sp.]